MVQRPNWRRFSLRTLMIAMAFTAVGCYWFMLPTLNARRFAAAMSAEDFAAADKLLLFRPDDDPFPGRMKDEFVSPPKVVIEPLTWHDLWYGERQLVVPVLYRVGDGGIADCTYVLRAKRDHLEVVLALP
jgi:hypothetical protein